MSRYVILPEARADLQQIYEYVAQYNPSSAIQLVERIEVECSLLADYPYLGVARPIFGVDYRSFAVPRTDYVIIYRPMEDGVEVHRVYHESRNFRRLFQQ